ncbi:MAG: CPBP family intramembrane glutamic endopeptidase [Persicimonas sp.]
MSSFRHSIKESNAGAYLLLFGSFLLFVIVSVIFVELVGPRWATLLAEVFGILAAALIWRAVMKGAAADWPEHGVRSSPAVLVVVVLAASAIGLFANSITSLLVETIPFMAEYAEGYAEQLKELVFDADGLNYWVGMVAVCVAAPLCEEALFRGTILQEQRKVEGQWLAVIINGLIFAAFHVNPVSGPGLVIVGSFLAYVTVKSGSLLPAIVGHAAINTNSALVLPALFPEMIAEDQEIEMSVILSSLVLFGLLSAGLWRLTAAALERETSERE